MFKFNAPKKTVASVLAAFQDTINDLQAVQEEQVKEAALQQEREEEARAAKEAAKHEASRAGKAITQFQTLIGGL